MLCPECNTELLPENININTDLAKCQSCSHIFKVSGHFDGEWDDGFDMNNPPAKTWCFKERNHLIIGASTRSPLAYFLVPFMIIWSGGSLGGIYGSQLIEGKFDLELSLFGIPFILGSIVLWVMTLMSIWGKVELTLDRNGGLVHRGIGELGYKKTFSWSEISTVTEKRGVGKSGSHSNFIIELSGEKRLTFGLGLPSDRRYYLYRSMKQILYKVKKNDNSFTPY